MKAVKTENDSSVLLIHDECIKNIRLRDAYTEYGERFGAYRDYSFDNIYSSCLNAAIYDYKSQYGHIDRNIINIQVNGPDTVVVENINGERQTEIETFFHNWAKNNVRLVECKAITYDFCGQHYSKIISHFPYDYPHISVFEELDERGTRKYINIYNRAEFPTEWTDKMKVCHVDNYLLVKMQDDIEVEYAKISKIPSKK